MASRDNDFANFFASMHFDSVNMKNKVFPITFSVTEQVVTNWRKCCPSHLSASHVIFLHHNVIWAKLTEKRSVLPGNGTEVLKPIRDQIEAAIEDSRLIKDEVDGYIIFYGSTVPCELCHVVMNSANDINRAMYFDCTDNGKKLVCEKCSWQHKQNLQEEFEEIIRECIVARFERNPDEFADSLFCFTRETSLVEVFDLALTVGSTTLYDHPAFWDLSKWVRDNN